MTMVRHGADEPLTVLSRFATLLRDAGIAAGIDRVIMAAEALGLLGLVGDTDPYWPLRVAFCTREAEIPTFDAVYRAWRGLSGLPQAVAAVGSVAAEPPEGSDQGEEPGGGASGGESAELAVRDIEELSAAELEQIKAWIELLAPAPRRRKAMRHRRARTGRVDVTRTMRLMLAHHGELTAIRHRRRVHRPRRLLLLVDVSESMEPYSDVFLHFAHAALAAGPHTTEVIAVGTRWTRLTDQLRASDPADAMRALAAVEAEWHGGTTLGRALQDLLRAWGGRNTVRGAVIVLASDGFEFGDRTLLRRQVARLSRLAGELIWIDPLRRSDDYVPLDRTLADAQSYATVRLAGHNFEALRELAKVIGR